MARKKRNGSRINTTARLKNGLLIIGISTSGSYRTWDWNAYVQRRAAPRSWQGYKTFTSRKGYVNKDSGSVRHLYGVKHRGRMRVKFVLRERGSNRRVIMYDRIR